MKITMHGNSQIIGGISSPDAVEIDDQRSSESKDEENIQAIARVLASHGIYGVSRWVCMHILYELRIAASEERKAPEVAK